MRHGFIPWQSSKLVDLLPKRGLRAVALRKATPLGSLCDIASGAYVSEYCRSDERSAAAYLRVDNVRQFVPNLTPGDVAFVQANTHGLNERTRVATGDIVLARTGTLGRTFVVDQFTTGAVMSQHVTRLRIREEYRGQLSPYALSTYLNSPEGKSNLIDLGTGSTRLELTHADLSSVLVPDAIFGIKDVALVRKLGQSIDEMFRGTAAACEAVQFFNREDVAEVGNWTQFHASALELESESWLPRFHSPAERLIEATLERRFVCEPLGDLADIQRGAGTTSREYETAGIPYVMTSSIINFGLEIFPENYGSESTYRAHGQEIGEGDILLTIEGRIGGVAMLGKGERCLAKNHIEVIRVHDPEKLPPEFLTAFLWSPAGQAQLKRRTIVQSTIPGISAASRTLRIPLAAANAQDQWSLRKAVDYAVSAVSLAVAARVAVRKTCGELLDLVKDVIA